MKYSMSMYAQLVEILRDREFELYAIRRNFNELSDKFRQLENAFAINLGVQRALESKLKAQKLEKKAGDTDENFLIGNVNKKTKARKELYSTLSQLRMEKERWKEAFFHQKTITEKRTLNQEKSIRTVRDECEKILKNCRENGEKYFRELLKLYEDSHGKGRILEEALKASKAWESTMKHRILELANFLETLKKFDGVRIEMLCQRTSKALRSLANGGDEPFEEGMRKLLHVSWDTREMHENRETLEFLQTQNSVLRQVIKSLKRKKIIDVLAFIITKLSCQLCHRVFAQLIVENCLRIFQDEFCDYPGSGKFSRNIRTNNYHDETFAMNENENEEKLEKSKNNETMKKIVFPEPEVNIPLEDMKNETKSENSMEKMDDKKNPENKNNRTEKSIYVEAFESHENGIPYEEYTFNFFNDKKLRVRHSNALGTKKSALNIVFVDTEKNFHEAPIDSTVFYLGENVGKILNFEKIVMNCGVQTRKLKIFEKYAQTTVTGSNGFFRINAGFGMLNSEKRAIERSLGSLESTVASLKENALGKARSMIGKGSKYLDDEFFDCMKRLET